MTETELRRIIDLAIEELGEKATKENVEAVVAEVIKEYEKGAPSLTLSNPKPPQPSTQETGRILVTAFGKNRVGIMSALTTVLAEHQCDLQDVSQKIMQEFFTLIMIVDISKSPSNFMRIREALIGAGERLGVSVHAQHEDIFKAMHRV
ncbi:MAG: ACT domain-containing protein [Chloroherpetonaceae bacterium]|nr:ACT domain-containing protein [Chloroherpetonaceae bacterium]MDW8438139.1 ACT domain-containing protein [Chloroherpetonaceae bacterium]